MHKEEIIRVLIEELKCVKDGDHLVYQPKSYECPIYFTPRDRKLAMKSDALDFEVPYEEILNIKEYPRKFEISLRHHNKVNTYTVWK